MRLYQVIAIDNPRGELTFVNYPPTRLPGINKLLEYISKAYIDITKYCGAEYIWVPISHITTSWLANLPEGDTYLSDHHNDYYVLITVFDID